MRTHQRRRRRAAPARPYERPHRKVLSDPTIVPERGIYMDGGHWLAVRYPKNTAFNMELRERFRKIGFERVRQGEIFYWRVPALYEAIPVLKDFALRWKLPWEEGLLEQMEKRASRERRLQEIHDMKTAELDVRSRRGYVPRPFQAVGCLYLLEAVRVLLGDDPGLGKTMQVINCFRVAQAVPALIVCPSSLRTNWATEIADWWPGQLVQKVTSGSQHLYRAPFTIINYDLLRMVKEADSETGKEKWVPGPMIERLLKLHSGGFKAVAYDEAHFLVNPKAQRSLACLHISRAVQKNNGYVIGMTGTPVVNRQKDLASILRICGLLSLFGGSVALDVLKPEEVHQRLRRIGFIRRKKEDVLRDLPPKSWAAIAVELSGSHKTRYDDAVADLKAWLRAEGEHERAERVNEQMEHLQRISYLKKLAALGKFEQACEWIEEFLASGKKLVVFVHHTDIAKGLAARFKAPLLIGESSADERDRAVRSFQENSACKMIVLNLKAGGVGLTLHAAQDVLLLEFPWSPATEDQAVDRLHRIGQNGSVTVWRMYATGTIEEEILGALDEKRHLAFQITDGLPEAEAIAKRLEILSKNVFAGIMNKWKAEARA